MIRAARMAGGQWGVIGVEQLRRCGVSEGTAGRWLAEGRLHRVHPGVYTLGHPSLPLEGRLIAALIHAGPGAALSHRSAAWWWKLLPDEPITVDVCSPARARSTAGVIVHHTDPLEATRHKGLRVTTVARTLRDLAATNGLSTVRYALANADYHHILNVNAVQRQLGRGRPGSKILREALERPVPQLAHTRSKFERELVPFCERYDIPIPEFNLKINGYPVDALWRPQRLIVELDGYDNHSSRAQIARDRRKDLILRAAGFIVLRYTWELFHAEPDAVAADIVHHLRAAA